ncbi:hypothetical protein MKX01_029100 [Papaver californicum]|nr:hypothetical protein MKX01_029100 [Papaver californicum]
MVRVLSNIMRARIIIITTIFLFLLLVTANSDPQINCSKTCVAQDCNSVGIRYGKFCGVGWTGCPGQKPCDDLDACCKIHDECVEKKVIKINDVRKLRKKTRISRVCVGVNLTIDFKYLVCERYEKMMKKWGFA